MKVYMVWNTEAKEGLVFDNKRDAESVLCGGRNQPAIADRYVECYPESNVIVECDVDVP